MTGCSGSGARAARPGVLVSLVRPLPTVSPSPVKPDKPIPVVKVPFQIHPRSDWSESPPIESRLEEMGKVTRLTIHHAGMDGEEASLEAVYAQLRRIQKSHEARMHAGDIGYHYIIDCDGRVFEGRPMKYQGAHAGNGEANKGNIGIVVMGNFEVEIPSSAQLDSLNLLVEHLMKKHKIPTSRVYTHREVKRLHNLGTTRCPGEALQAKINLMRTRLAKAEGKKK